MRVCEDMDGQERYPRREQPMIAWLFGPGRGLLHIQPKVGAVPLTIELKPHEKLFLNGAVVANGEDRASLVVLNDAAILREKDILSEQNADSPCKRIYFVIQSMYMDPKNRHDYEELYARLVREVVVAAPSTAGLIGQMDQDVESDRLYSALKTVKKLVEYEQELMNHARQSA